MLCFCLGLLYVLGVSVLLVREGKLSISSYLSMCYFPWCWMNAGNESSLFTQNYTLPSFLGSDARLVLNDCSRIGLFWLHFQPWLQHLLRPTSDTRFTEAWKRLRALDLALWPKQGCISACDGQGWKVPLKRGYWMVLSGLLRKEIQGTRTQHLWAHSFLVRVDFFKPEREYKNYVKMLKDQYFLAPGVRITAVKLWIFGTEYNLVFATESL